MRHLFGSSIWDFYSLTYDFTTRSVLKKARKNYIDQLLKLSSSEKEIENILIIGVGTGEDLQLISPEVDVVATDYSKSMLKKAERKVMSNQNVQFIQMDAHHLNFKDDSFQRILMPLIITITQNPIQCIKEAERVLKPSGRLIVFDKFLHRDQEPSLFRKSLNLFTNLIATNINIDFHHLISQTNLTIIKETDSLFGGWFKIFILKK